MGFTITPPASMDTPLKRWRWAMRWDENLRIIHNWMGVWYTQGKTQAQYNNALVNMDNYLTRKIRNVFPYAPQLTEQQWSFFVAKHHQLTQALHRIMHENRPAVPNQSEEDRAALLAEAEAAKADGTLDVDTTMTEA